MFVGNGEAPIWFGMNDGEMEWNDAVSSSRSCVLMVVVVVPVGAVPCSALPSCCMVLHRVACGVLCVCCVCCVGCVLCCVVCVLCGMCVSCVLCVVLWVVCVVCVVCGVFCVVCGV